MASRFYALMFVALTGLLGMVSPPDLALMTAQAQINQDRKAESDRLLREGKNLRSQGKHQLALEKLNQALAIYIQEKDRTSQIETMAQLAHVYNLLANRSESVKLMNQAIQLSKDIGNKPKEASLLNDLGWFYFFFILDRNKGIDYYNQALSIYQSINDRSGQAGVLTQLGWAFYYFGENQKSLDAYNLAIKLAREDKNQYAEASALLYISQVYTTLKQRKETLDALLMSRDIYNSLKVVSEEARVYRHLGGTYATFGDIQLAEDSYLKSISIYRKLGNRLEEGYVSLDIASLYRNEGNITKAIEFLNRSLYIRREVGERSEEARVLNTIGALLEENKQVELAIIFYKETVNVIESIRKDLKSLSKDDQKTYTNANASTYRTLADLLLKQDRILEAQQVLDLLKVEELNEYLRTPTRSSQTEQGTELRNQEKTFIALALELDELQKRKLTNNITTAEQERLNQLVQSEREQNKQFTAFLNSPTVQKLVDELRRTEEQQNIDTKNLRNLRTDILTQHPNAVLLYPLILEDRLELILITAKTTPIRRTINIKREKLNQEITNFLAGLRDASSQDIQKPAQQMYTWLIKPFETELAELKIDTIVYAPDGQLRYIPLAALHDGKQWLVEKYRVNNITAASLTKFNKPPISTPKIFAGAFGNVNQQGFTGLPATLTEVKKIADRFPNTTTFVETAFTKNVTENNSNSYTVLHLATHGELSSGKPEDSFILFGDGTKATIADIQEWALTNVDLVVLSACQSGLGSKLGNGVEILGLGYQIQAAGARMSIATLWKVSDVGTEKLMDAFYTAVKTSKVSNVEALRQAQVAMITDNYEGLGETRGIVSIEARPRSTPSTAPTKISHPYYWAAFILIGNGL
jgi:CHAT domain-containing protein